MALIKCAECGKKVSTEASACPGCGAKVQIPIRPVKTGMSGVFKVVLVLLLIGPILTGLNHLFGKSESERNASILAAEQKRVAALTPEQKASEAKAKADADAKVASEAAKKEQWKIEYDHKKKIESLAGDLAFKAKASLNDPESAKFENIKVSPEGDLICGGVNAKNKFGGYTGTQNFAYLAGKGFYSGHEADKLCFDSPKYQPLRIVTYLSKALNG